MIRCGLCEEFAALRMDRPAGLNYRDSSPPDRTVLLLAGNAVLCYFPSTENASRTLPAVWPTKP